MTDFAQLQHQTDQLLGIYQAAQHEAQRLDAEVAALQGEIQILTLASTALDTLLKTVSLESTEDIEKLVSYGLKTIFPDQPMTFVLQVEQKFKTQWMTPKLLCSGVEAPVLDSFGGGPASVVAFLLRVLVCRRLGLAPLILLDEPFSMVSAEYTDGVGQLLRELAEKLGMTFLVVTHNRDLCSAAHHSYEIVQTATGAVFRPS